jgi:hypothetical protein
MLKYQDLSPEEKEMVDVEMSNLFGSTMETVIKEATKDVHKGKRCANCFLPEHKCVCDQLEKVLNSMEKNEYILHVRSSLWPS